MNKSTNNTVVTRFAPSPTGPFHIGGARTALFNYVYAKKKGGQFILRIEDTDRERSKPEYEQDIRSGLSWLGLEPDSVEHQSKRADIYREHIKTLIKNDAAYASEEERDGKPSNVIRFRNPGGTVVFQDEVRGEISMPVDDLGDFVIAKSEDEPLYHLAVVIDDYEMGITHVIRGEDHISNTPRQILLQQAIGAPRPVYAHLPLILAPDRSKLSKRHGAVSVNDFQSRGYLPDAMFNFLALLGWSPQAVDSDRQEGGEYEDIFLREELIEMFSLDHIQKGGAVFDVGRLRWINGYYLHKLSSEEAQGYLKKHLPDWLENEEQFSEERLARSIPLILERIKVANDFETLWEEGEFVYLFKAPEYDSEKLPGKGSNPEEAQKHLERVRELWNKLPDTFSSDEAKDSVWEYATQQGRGAVLWPVRVALSGKEKSADPFSIASALGKKETLARLNAAIEKLSA